LYKHILIATDGSELATRGLTQGLELAKSLGAAATIVTVTEAWSALEMSWEARSGRPSPTIDYDRAATDSARKILDAASGIAGKQGIKAETVHVTDRHPAEGILEVAGSKGCDLIVMASHGRRGIGRMLLGSQTAEVLATTTVPVLVIR
jgi:nucleotide-binding universal stress UspA family protein